MKASKAARATLALAILAGLTAHPLRLFAAEPEARYVVTIAEDHQRVARVHGEFALTGGVLRMTAEGAGHLPNGWSTFVRNLRVADSKGGQLEAQRTQKDQWSVAGAPDGPLAVDYEISMTHDEHPWPFGKDESAYVSDDGVFFVSRALFIRTPGIRAIEVRFEIPASWRVSTPWQPIAGRPKAFFVKDEAELTGTCLAIGAHFERTIRTGGCEVTLALGGGLKESAPMLEEFIGTSLRTYGELFGGTPTARFLIVMNPGAPHPFYWGGGAFPNSISIIAPNVITKANRADGLDTVGHEIFHLWNGQTLKPRGQLEWFKEGVTDYFTWVLLGRNGYIERKVLFYQLAKHGGLYLDSAGKATIQEAGLRKREFYDLVYSGGAMVALAMDVGIRKETGGEKSLDDFMRELYVRCDQGQGRYDIPLIVSVAQSVSGKDFHEFFDRYVTAKEVIPLGSIFADAGLEMESTQLGNKTRLELHPKAEPSAEQRKIMEGLFGREAP